MIISGISVLMAIICIAVALLLKENRDLNFWLGLTVTILVLAATTAVVIFCTYRQKNPAVEISITVFSIIYFLVTVAVNLLMTVFASISVGAFAGIHVLCLLIYGIIVLLLAVVKDRVMQQEKREREDAYELQALMYEYEKVRNKLMTLQPSVRKEIMTQMDRLMEEMRFSDFAAGMDTSEADSRLRVIAERLSEEVDQWIGGSDEAAEKMMTKKIKSDIENAINVVKDRKMQIALMKKTI